MTKDPDALSATYPKAPRETFVQVALPRLLNQAGVIGLLTKDELVLDLLHYRNALRPKGMKNKVTFRYAKKQATGTSQLSLRALPPLERKILRPMYLLEQRLKSPVNECLPKNYSRSSTAHQKGCVPSPSTD